MTRLKPNETRAQFKVLVEMDVTCPACHGYGGNILIRLDDGSELREPCIRCNYDRTVKQKRWVHPETAERIEQDRQEHQRFLARRKVADDAWHNRTTGANP